MSGKRRLSATGKWLLDSSGKAKICTCCNDPCPDCCGCYYRITAIGGSGSCESCTIPLQTLYFGPYDCNCTYGYEGDFTYGLCKMDDPDPQTYLYFGYTVVDCPDTPTVEYRLAVDDCPADGTYVLEPYGFGAEFCTGNLTVIIERIYCPDCCPCLDNCYYIEVTGGDPDDSCDNCGTEESGMLIMADCGSTHPTVDGWGQAGLAWRSPDDDPADWPEPANTLIPVGSWYFSWASTILGDCYTPPVSDMIWVAPVDVSPGVTACVVPGVYTLYVANEDDFVYCSETNTKTVTITQVACCDGVADGSETPYFVSFDVVSTIHSAAGTISDCLGTGGTEDCNSAATYTDLQLDPQIGQSVCYRVTTDEVTCTPGAMSRSVFLINNNGTWELHFGDLTSTYPSMISIGAAAVSPVGTYPDVASCEFDANYAHNVSITNIVVTA